MHAGEGLGVLGDVGDGALVDVERDEAVCLSALCGAARQLRDGLARDAQHVGETADDLLVGLLVCADEHGERRAIAHQLDSVAVEDAPARGHGRVLGDAVLLGLGAVVLAADDLHGPQLDEERAQTHAGQPHEGEEAAAHVGLAVHRVVVDGLGGCHGRVGLGRVELEDAAGLLAGADDDDDEDDRRDEEQDDQRCAHSLCHGRFTSNALRGLQRRA